MNGLETEVHANWMREAIRLSAYGMVNGHGGPFGAVIVKDGRLIGSGFNKVLSSNDPTAHAEIVAIREACMHLKHFQLEGCTVYTSCEPCPMCLGALYWARPDRIFFANSRRDAASIGFDDDFIYREITFPINQRQIPTEVLLQEEAMGVFKQWVEKSDKIRY